MSGKLDLEQANERTPLAKKTLSSIDKFFMKDKNAKFAQDFEVAFRAACFVLFLGIPFFLPRDEISKWNPWIIDLIDRGWYGKYAVACFLFSYYKDLGNTVNLACTTILGTWMAVFGIWILFGVYPEGILPGAAQWHYAVCFCYGGLFVWIMLWLNLPLNTTIFGISSFVWYYMAFMDKNVTEKNFAKGFAIDLQGSATKELLNATGGSLLAVLAMCFPRQISAAKAAVDGSRIVLSTLLTAWKDLTQFICARTEDEMNEFEEASIKRALRDMSATVAAIRGNLDTAWWECLGTGGIQRQRVMLDSLDTFLSESYDRILSVFTVALAEKSPSEIAQRVRPYVDRVIDECGALLNEALGAVADTRVTGERQQRLRVCVMSTRDAVRTLTREFRQVKASSRPTPGILDRSLFSEHAFALTVCSFGNGCADWGEGLAEGRYQDPNEGGFLGLGSLKSIINEKVIFQSEEHMLWTLRNWLAICLSFIVGFYGQIWGWNLTRPYNAAITSTMAVLLSKSMSTGVGKNLGRLQGVILGTAIGVKLYAIFATDCSWAGTGSLMVSVFLWMNFCFFLYHNSDTNSYLAFLLGYCGTMNMIGGCGMVSNLAIGSTVMDLLMTIVIMAAFDMIFQRETAASMAHRQVTKTADRIRNSLKELVDPNYPTIDFGGGALLGQISLAETMGGMAEAEARWSRTPWRKATFQAVIASLTRIRYIMTGMKCAAAGGSVSKNKPETLLALLSCPGWSSVASRPTLKFDQVNRLMVILRHETEGSLQEYKDTEMEIRHHGPVKLPGLIDAVCAQANAHPLLRNADTSDSLETDPAARQSYLIGGIAAVMEELRFLESQIIYEG